MRKSVGFFLSYSWRGDMAKRNVDPRAIDNYFPPLLHHHPSYPASAQRRRKGTTSGSAGPSPSVLSLLATISAASYPVDGSPLASQPTPPPFLCPFIDTQDHHDVYDECRRDLIPEASSSATPVTNNIPTPTHKPKKRAVTLADRFEQGPDGQWRRVDEYTIYGSTVCNVRSPLALLSMLLAQLYMQNCSPTPATKVSSSSPTSSVEASGAVYTSAAATTTASTDQFDVATPNGWSTPKPVDTWRFKLVLSISIVLSFLICMVMIGIMFWRRRKKQRAYESDEELKLQKRRGSDVSEQQALKEQAARVKKKFWALSTARWKAGVRVSARRRMNMRLATAAQTTATKTSSPAMAETISISRSTSPHPTNSNRTSLALDRSSTPIPECIPSAGPSLPPAYIQRTALSSQAKISGHSTSIDFPQHAPPPLTNDEYNTHPDYPESIPSGDDPIPYDNSPVSHHLSHAAHVATDDKTLLARMADLASAPQDGHVESTSLPVSAPVWQDEELEEFPHPVPLPTSSSSTPEASSSSCISDGLPSPPPSHNKSPDFYDYPQSYDVASEGPEAEPSAPPFVDEHLDGPSAPPVDTDVDLAPSAPPLLDARLLSTPAEWDWLAEEEGVAHGHDRHTVSPSNFLPLPLYRA